MSEVKQPEQLELPGIPPRSCMVPTLHIWSEWEVVAETDDTVQSIRCCASCGHVAYKMEARGK